MNWMDRIVLDPVRTYACTRTARTGVRVTRAVKRALNGAPAKSILSEIMLDVGGSAIPRLRISCINGR